MNRILRAITLTIVLGAMCCGPVAAQTFVDVTAEAGIDHVQATAAGLVGLPGSAFFTGGVAAGDFNGDGSVDAADYSAWRDGLGTLYSQQDYRDWRENFGKTQAPLASSN
ncbi:MAG: hypothetical protein KDA61_04205, partial [Planctomycetales bacterium]|nr:hypothetical protein [Planctomycetales bacterium]